MMIIKRKRRVLLWGRVLGTDILVFSADRVSIIMVIMLHAMLQYSPTITKYAQ